MRNAQKDFTSNTCHELMRFFAFDSLLFNNSASEFNDLYCEVCLDGNTNGIADAPFVPYYDTIEFELCYYVEDSGIDDTDFQDVGWNVVNNPGTFGGGNTGGNFTVIFGGIYSGLSPLTIPSNPGSSDPGNDNIGQLLSDIGDAIGSFFGGAVSTIGDFFSGLFSKKNKYRRCPRVGFTSPDQLESRTLTFICSPYVMLRCNNGRWWETIALIPCDGCNVEEELEKEKEKVCNEFKDEVNQTYEFETGSPVYKMLQLAMRDCCTGEQYDIECVEIKLLENALDFIPTDDELEYILSETILKQEIFDMLNESYFLDVCGNGTSPKAMLHNAIVNAYGDDYEFDIDEVYEELGANSDFVQTYHVDKNPKLKCVFDKLRTFGLCGEIINNYQEIAGDLKLRIIYDHDGTLPGSNNGLRFPYNQNGSFCCGQSDYADTEVSVNYDPNLNYESAYSTIYWNKWFPNLSELEMCSYFIHEMLHSEFHRWVSETVYPAPLTNSAFMVNGPVWQAIVLKKYGSNAQTNHHQLMNYFVQPIAENLWALNGETDPNRIDHYKYFVYDLFHTDAGLVADGFLTQSQLNTYKNLSQSISSNINCD